MNEIDIDKGILLDFLDQSVNGNLYSTMSEGDDIVRVEITPISVIFTIGKSERQIVNEALAKAED